MSGNFSNFALFFFENSIENEYSENWMVWSSRNGSLPHGELQCAEG